MFKYSAFFVLLLLTVVGCSHVVHEANIKEGLNGSVLIVPKRSTSGNYGYSQFGLGDGFELKNGKKLLLMSTAALYRDGYEKHFQFTGLDLYYQTKTTPAYAGIGAVLGLDPRIYFMWGVESNKNDSRYFSRNYAVGWGVVGSVNVQASLIYHIKATNIGLFGEYRYYYVKFNGDENGPADNAIGGVAFLGLLFGIN
jgi:hypothetical protein